MKKSNIDIEWFDKIPEEGVNFTHPEIMAKIVATIDSEESPHITMIASNKAVDEYTIKWGQFTEGLSKKNIINNPKQGFLFMTAQMPFKFIQMKANYDYCSTEASDANDFNTTDLMRYNVYMRIYKTYYNKIVSSTAIRDISLFGIIKGIIVNIGGKRRFKTGKVEKRLPPFGMKLFNGLVFPKFIAYLDPQDGFPVILPCFQARAIENKQIIFTFSQFKNDLRKIPVNAKVAIFVMDFELETMLVKGTFIGMKHNRGIIDIEKVYNSMPPKPGYIYPELEVKQKVTNFTL